ncbi:hypothetical protein BDV96DRAFT_638628 [Lophiotrema nucula]|uniref:Uncharacterized protein n=1 Tax=Lophiotrema nucula TaxID=690887 RepID=A0A6A5YEM0_9PLEO|nr:hypothetical protein BDV96DRAFT_638628 [Lophiotrema nucula]
MVFLSKAVVASLVVATATALHLGAWSTVEQPVHKAPALDLKALAQPELGALPAQMLVYLGAIAELHSHGNTTGQSSTATLPQQTASAADKSQRDSQNGAVLGSVVGNALAAGIGNAMEGATQAICKALAAGAASGFSVKVGQWSGAITADKEKGNQTVALVNGTTTTETSVPTATLSDFEQGFVSPALSGVAGGTVSNALSKGICANFDKIVKGLKDAGRFAGALPRILESILDETKVPIGDATQFVSNIQFAMQYLDQNGLANSLPALEHSLATGASQVADAVAAGYGAELAGPLGAMSELAPLMSGALPAVDGSISPAAGSISDSATAPFEALQVFTGQLSQLNQMISTLPGVDTAASKQVGSVLNSLHGTASKAADVVRSSAKGTVNGAKDAVNAGKKVLSGSGKPAFDALTHLIPEVNHDSKEKKVEHVTQTHHTTVTQHKTVTHVLKPIHKTTQTAKETKTVLTTETRLATMTTATMVRTTLTATTLMTRTATQTTTQTHQIAAPTGFSSTERIQKSLFEKTAFPRNGRAYVNCIVNSDSHLQCAGFVKNPIKYKEVKDYKFEECVAAKDPKCFSGDASGGLHVYLDRPDQTRGVACMSDVSRDGKMMCWGTPNKSTIRYDKLDPKRWQSP